MEGESGSSEDQDDEEYKQKDHASTLPTPLPPKHLFASQGAIPFSPTSAFDANSMRGHPVSAPG